MQSFVLLHNSLFGFVYCYLFSLYLAALYKHKIKQMHSLSILTLQKTKHFFTKISKYKKRTKVAPQEKNKRAGCRFSLIFLSFLAFRADLPAQLVYFNKNNLWILSEKQWKNPLLIRFGQIVLHSCSSLAEKIRRKDSSLFTDETLS